MHADTVDEKVFQDDDDDDDDFDTCYPGKFGALGPGEAAPAISQENRPDADRRASVFSVRIFPALRPVTRRGISFGRHPSTGNPERDERRENSPFTTPGDGDGLAA